MSLTNKLIRVYFNYAYNLVYDFTTVRFKRYRSLHKKCVGKLKLRNDDRVLCVGIGTGNEILQILRLNRNVSIVGIDYSNTALNKARRKALRLGKEIELFLMDAQSLEFAAESFDKVLCLHVMDFVENKRQVTKEILRVLKAGGRYVITYPSAKEGLKLGFNLFKDGYDLSSGNNIFGCLQLPMRAMMGVVYLPLLLRPNKRSYSTVELEKMITEVTNGDFQIEEDAVYQDLIVNGTKVTKGGKSNAF